MKSFYSTVADIELFCRPTFGVQDSLNKVTPVPYRDFELPSKLRFGYYTSGTSVSFLRVFTRNNIASFPDGFVKASPANRRAVLETVAALEKIGHECVEFEVPKRKLVSTTTPNALTAYLIIFTQRRMRWSSSLRSHPLMVIRK